MYDIVIRYLASVYLDTPSLKPSSKLTADLLQALGDDKYIPVPVAEGLQGVPRIGFVTPNDGWKLILGSERINLTLEPTSLRGKNMIEFPRFLDIARQQLGRLLSFLGRRANRIAVVQEGLLPEMNQEQMQRSASELFRFPPVFQAHHPFEWDLRFAAQVRRNFGTVRDEVTNTIVMVKRLSGNVTEGGSNTLEFERIRSDFDINTSPDNIAERFGPDEVNAFMNAMPEWHGNLMAEMRPILLGR